MLRVEPRRALAPQHPREGCVLSALGGAHVAPLLRRFRRLLLLRRTLVPTQAKHLRRRGTRDDVGRVAWDGWGGAVQRGVARGLVARRTLVGSGQRCTNCTRRRW